MEKIYATFAVLFLVTLQGFAQQWVELNTGFTQPICDIQFVDANTGYIVISGNPLKILKTTDRGNAWTQVYSVNASVSNSASIEMLNVNTGFLYYDKYVIKTSNGFSNSTTSYQLPANSKKHNIKFLNAQTGYLLMTYPDGEVGVSIYKTTNSGNSWFITAIDHLYNNSNVYTYAQLTDIDALSADPNTIFVTGYVQYINSSFDTYLLWKSTNGLLSTPVQLPCTENPDRFDYLSTVPNSSNDVFASSQTGIYKYDGTGFNQLSGLGGFGLQYGLTFSSLTKGYLANSDKMYFSSNGGQSWNVEYTSNNINSYSPIHSFGDIAYKGESNGKLLVRRPTINLKANYDWQSGNYVEPFTIETDEYGVQYFYTPQYNINLRGGTHNCSTNIFKINGGDTTAIFYYWGGVGNASMGTDAYFENSGDFNEDFKTKLKSTTPEALKYSPQVKTIKDTNGVTNLVYESMEGIFFTRTKPDGSFKCEEIVSGTSPYPYAGGYATFGNSNPYIAEIKPYVGAANEVPKEENIAVVWEERVNNGQDIAIYRAARDEFVNTFRWNKLLVTTISGAPAGFKAFPKIVEAGTYNGSVYYEYGIITFLKPESGGNKSIQSTYFNSAGGGALNTLVASGDISDYAVAFIYSPDNSQKFHLHIAYKQSNRIYYQHHQYSPGYSWNHFSGEDFQISSNEIQRYRFTPDITLRNVSNNPNAVNMQPVVSYQGEYVSKVAIETQGDGFQYVNNTYYPIIIRERLANGSWAPENLQYNSQIQQQNPNIEGSKTRNSYMVNYSQNNNTFYQRIPRWEGSTSSGMFCDPGMFSGTDAKFVKGGLINENSSNQSKMTLSPSGSIYGLEKQDFAITNIPTADGNFDGVTGIVVADNMQYSFNLGSIMINSNLVYFNAIVDTSIGGTVVEELNDNMRSRNFYLSNNDTLVLGRDAFYLPSGAGSYTGIKYTVDLVSSGGSRVLRTLASDTIHVEDTVQVEYLEGWIIDGIDNGSDSFYVQLSVEPIEVTDISGGYISGGNGSSSGGDAPGLKRKIFWHGVTKETSSNIPVTFNLYQNFPNPFNPSTTIKYDLPKDVSVNIRIYDLLGREVAVLAKDEFKKAGRYEINWNASNMASGVYIYRIEAGDYKSTKKMVLIK
jgi:hypothetical protein